MMTRSICCFHSHENLLIAHCTDGTLWAKPIGQSTAFQESNWLQIAGIPEDSCEECGGTEETGHQRLCSKAFLDDDEYEDEDDDLDEEDWEESFRDLQKRIGRFILEIDEASDGDLRGLIRKHRFNHFLKGKR